MTPLLAMCSLGHAFIPPAIHAGGLRYHGMAPLVCAGVRSGLLTPRAYPQLEAYEAAVTFARTEGLIPAPETSHAIVGAIDEAKRATEEGKEKVILFNYSGHGLLDLGGYQAYFADELHNYPLPPEVLERSLAVLASHPTPPGA
jgi:tryptophan synthase beta chain